MKITIIKSASKKITATQCPWVIEAMGDEKRK